MLPKLVIIEAMKCGTSSLHYDLSLPPEIKISKQKKLDFFIKNYNYLFHLGVYFSMTITFEQNCLWLALFFINSPFLPVRFDWRQILQDLPLVGLLFSKYSKLAF